MRHNLVKLMADSKISIISLHQETEVPLTTIKRMRQINDSNPTINSLLPIADYFSVSINQLIGASPLPYDRKVGQHFKKRGEWMSLPILTWESATVWPINKESLFLDTLSITSTDLSVSPNGFALPIETDDFLQFQKGSLLIIDPDIQPIHRDFVITHKKDHKTASLNQILMDENDTYLKPPNPEYKIKELDRSYVIKGVIVQIRKDFRS